MRNAIVETMFLLLWQFFASPCIQQPNTKLLVEINNSEIPSCLYFSMTTYNK